ncbi:MAG: ribosomal RNA small subunit methyltransferase A, partial [Actinobacteria bacterium]
MVAVVRLGQNFLADPNLLEAIVRDAELGADDVVLEVGAGEGVLSQRLAAAAGHLHAVEIDRGLEEALAPVAALPNVELHWGDAMKFDLAALEPAPTAMVANLPYSVATPLILRTIEELPSLQRWTVMVQREIADRLRAGPGSRTYGSPSAVAQLACEVELLRAVDPAVF